MPVLWRNFFEGCGEWLNVIVKLTRYFKDIYNAKQKEVAGQSPHLTVFGKTTVTVSLL